MDDPRFKPAEFQRRYEPAPRTSWRVVTTEGVDLLTQCEEFMIMLALNRRVTLAIELPAEE